MFSKESASRRFARINQDHDILMWRYATEQSEPRRAVLGYRILGLKLKQSLLGAFYKSVLNLDNEDTSLRNAVVHAASLTPAGAVSRALAMRDTIELWEKAKTENDFSVVEDSLRNLVKSIKDEARYKAEKLGLNSPYEALLQSKTPGFSCASFESWAQELEEFCADTLLTLPAPQNAEPLELDAQRRMDVTQNMLVRMGYDFDRGKVKTAMHPLCLGMHDDVRIGVRRGDPHASSVVLTLAHEGGHGLYRQGLPEDLKDDLDGQIAGVGMDEAMALLMENHVGRDKGFADFIAAQIGVTPQAYYQEVTQLSDKPIRTQADEVRYPLDVILRYKIEKALIDDDMDVADIPSFWATEFEKMTGMVVDHDNEGVLQDIHWFGGEIGWFPNYLVGQLAAAQLFEKACDEIPSLQRDIAEGNFVNLTDWLRDNIYKQGAVMTTFELIETVTGKTLDVDAYKRHINDRYLRPLRAPQPPHGPSPHHP